MFHKILISGSIITDTNLPFPNVTSLTIHNSKSEHIKTYIFDCSNKLPSCINIDQEKNDSLLNNDLTNNEQNTEELYPEYYMHLPFKKRYLRLSEELHNYVENKRCKKEDFESQTRTLDFNGKFSDLNGKFSDLNAEFSDINAEFSDINPKFSDINPKFFILNPKFFILNSNLKKQENLKSKIIINDFLEGKYLQFNNDDIKRDWQQILENSDLFDDSFMISKFFNSFLIDFLRNFKLDLSVFNILKRALKDKKDLGDYINILYKVEELIKYSACSPILSETGFFNKRMEKLKIGLDKYKPRNPQKTDKENISITRKNPVFSAEKCLRQRLEIRWEKDRNYIENYLKNEISGLNDGLDSFIIFIFYYISLIKKSPIYKIPSPLYFLIVIRRFVICNENFLFEQKNGLCKHDFFEFFKIMLKLSNFKMPFSSLNETDSICEKFFNIRSKIQKSKEIDQNLQRELLTFLGSIHPFYVSRKDFQFSDSENHNLKLICEILGRQFIRIGLIIFDKRKSTNK